jgi:hypothetical protein
MGAENLVLETDNYDVPGGLRHYEIYDADGCGVASALHRVATITWSVSGTVRGLGSAATSLDFAIPGRCVRRRAGGKLLGRDDLVVRSNS